MIAIYLIVGVFALIGLLVVLVALAAAVGVLLDVRRDRHRIALERLADPTPDPDLDDPSLGGLVVEIPTYFRRAR